jgi:hypothetical protein
LAWHQARPRDRVRAENRSGRSHFEQVCHICSGYLKLLSDCYLKCWVMLRCGQVNVQLVEPGSEGLL